MNKTNEKSVLSIKRAITKLETSYKAERDALFNELKRAQIRKEKAQGFRVTEAFNLRKGQRLFTGGKYVVISRVIRGGYICGGRNGGPIVRVELNNGKSRPIGLWAAVKVAA